MLSHIARKLSPPRVVAIVLALTAAVMLSLLPTWRAQAATPTPAPAAETAGRTTIGQPGRILVLGRIAHPLRLTVADLASKYPQHTQTVTFASGAGQQTHTYTGPLLYDVLRAAGPSFRAEVKNDALRYAVVVHASDGYESVVSWGEIDPGFAGSASLLAVTEDGASLATTGPRLTAPEDTKGGRYVSGVTTVVLARVGQ